MYFCTFYFFFFIPPLLTLVWWSLSLNKRRRQDFCDDFHFAMRLLSSLLKIIIIIIIFYERLNSKIAEKSKKFCFVGSHNPQLWIVHDAWTQLHFVIVFMYTFGFFVGTFHLSQQKKIFLRFFSWLGGEKLMTNQRYWIRRWNFLYYNYFLYFRLFFNFFSSIPPPHWTFIFMPASVSWRFSFRP